MSYGPTCQSVNGFRGDALVLPTERAVFSQEQHAMAFFALAHGHTWAVPEGLGGLSFLVLVVTARAECTAQLIFVTGEPLENNSCDTTITAEVGIGALCVDLGKFADGFQALRGRLSIAGKGISHGGERWQECRSQGDTKQNGFVFGA